eukprot:jgi/Bigna1/125634/aug1.1_g342
MGDGLKLDFKRAKVQVRPLKDSWKHVSTSIRPGRQEFLTFTNADLFNKRLELSLKVGVRGSGVCFGIDGLQDGTLKVEGDGRVETGNKLERFDWGFRCSDVNFTTYPVSTYPVSSPCGKRGIRCKLFLNGNLAWYADLKLKPSGEESLFMGLVKGADFKYKIITTDYRATKSGATCPICGKHFQSKYAIGGHLRSCRKLSPKEARERRSKNQQDVDSEDTPQKGIEVISSTGIAGPPSTPTIIASTKSVEKQATSSIPTPKRRSSSRIQRKESSSSSPSSTPQSQKKQQKGRGGESFATPTNMKVKDDGGRKKRQKKGGKAKQPSSGVMPQENGPASPNAAHKGQKKTNMADRKRKREEADGHDHLSDSIVDKTAAAGKEDEKKEEEEEEEEEESGKATSDAMKSQNKELEEATSGGATTTTTTSSNATSSEVAGSFSSPRRNRHVRRKLAPSSQTKKKKKSKNSVITPGRKGKRASAAIKAGVVGDKDVDTKMAGEGGEMIICDDQEEGIVSSSRHTDAVEDTFEAATPLPRKSLFQSNDQGNMESRNVNEYIDQMETWIQRLKKLDQENLELKQKLTAANREKETLRKSHKKQLKGLKEAMLTRDQFELEKTAYIAKNKADVEKMERELSKYQKKQEAFADTEKKHREAEKKIREGTRKLKEAQKKLEDQRKEFKRSKVQFQEKNKKLEEAEAKLTEKEERIKKNQTAFENRFMKARKYAELFLNEVAFHSHPHPEDVNLAEEE